MTSDTELPELPDLPDLRTAEAGAANARPPAPGDHIVRRGRHHRRGARVGIGLAAGGLAALAVAGVIAVTGSPDDGRTTVVADLPDGTTVPAVPDIAPPATPTTDPDVPVTPSADARGSGVFVTITIVPSDPATGFDPCQALAPVVTETETDVTVAVVDAGQAAGGRWAACQASPRSGWATVELTDPVGTRRLLDARDDHEIPVIANADLLFPTWIPTPFDIEHWDERGGEALVDRTFSWSEDDRFLDVTSSPLEQPMPFGQNPGDGCTGDPITVRGVEGSLCQSGEGSFTLMWDEGRWRRQIEMGPVRDNVSSFTLDDALAVADGLEPLG